MDEMVLNYTGKNLVPRNVRVAHLNMIPPLGHARVSTVSKATDAKLIANGRHGEMGDTYAVSSATLTVEGLPMPSSVFVYLVPLAVYLMLKDTRSDLAILHNPVDLGEGLLMFDSIAIPSLAS